MTSSTHKSGTVSFTSGTLWKQLTLFALPVALTGIVQQLFHSADTAVIGHYVGKNATAAVGCSGPLVNLPLEFFIGLSNSAGVVIARFLGRNDGKRPNDAVHTAVPAAIICGFLAAGPGIILSSPVLRLMSVPDEIFSDALLYLRVYLIGMPFFMLNQFLCAIFHSKGDSSTPLICLTAAGAVNVGLNLLFVLAFSAGIAGVAWTTVIANGISASVLLLLLIRANDATKLSLTRLHIDRELLLMMIRIGIPSGFLGSIFSVSNVAAQSAINSLGADVVAGSAAALNIEIYIQFFGNAFASAGTTAVSQNYGAGDLRRCRRVIGMSIALCEIATVTLSAAAFLSGRKLLLIFVSDAAVIEIAMRRMRYTILFKFITSMMDITNGCLQGFGYTMVPALISVFGVCGVRLLWLWLVFPAHPSIDCVMVIYPFTQGFAAVVQLFLCMRPPRIPVRKKHK